MVENPEPHRRRFQFSLRTLFVVVTVAAIILGVNRLAVRPIEDIYWDDRISYEDNGWWKRAVIVDLIAVGAGIWIVARKP